MWRRDFLKQAALALTLLHSRSALAAESMPFDFAWLKQKARTLARRAFVKPSQVLPDALVQRSWEQFQFRPERALWAGGQSRFAVQFFHRSGLFREQIEVFEVVSGRARRVRYERGMFDYARIGLSAETLPADLGFAGLRLLFDGEAARDVSAFLGASYFRAVGAGFQYGLSARGLAIDTATERREEFPLFRCFWLERPAPGAGTLIVYALLDSESITGAYRFAITPGPSQRMDVELALYPRKPVERLGIAPATSMFLCGENDRRLGYDVRPELHDSDGLSIWTGRGEWIWRPLMNPRQLSWNAFVDEHPRGFGLLQRDRSFESYQDDTLLYDQRPGLWVEPSGDWGRGSVQLVEIPTVDETFDNVVAFFCPERPLAAHEELALSYRLHWGAEPPVQPELAQTVATRLGLGGTPGQPRKHYACRFMVDFSGRAPPPPASAGAIEPVVQLARGRVELATARVLQPGTARGQTRYRAVFDVVPPDSSQAPIELRLFLRAAGQALTETWLYHWQPPAAGERQLY